MDLSSIISIETTALLRLGTIEDLKRVVQLETLGLQISPSQWLFSLTPGIDIIYRAEQLGRRAAAYYSLGDLDNGIADSTDALNLVPRTAALVSSLSAGIVIAYLRKGDTEKAMKFASSWYERNHDPRSARTLQVLKSNQSNPQEALAEIMRAQ